MTYACPDPDCPCDCATFGSLLSHLRSDHGISPSEAFNRYGRGEANAG